MLWLFRRKAAVSPSEAARILSASRGQNDRERRRAMCNQIRADLRAKGRDDMVPVDWSAI